VRLELKVGDEVREVRVRERDSGVGRGMRGREETLG